MRWGSARTARTSGETRALESEVPRHESRAPRSGEQFVFAIFICSAASLWILIRFHSFETSSAWAFIRLNFPLFKLSSVWTLCTHSQTPRLNFEASSPESDKRVFLVVSFSLKHLESASTRLERLLREYSATRFEWRCTGLFTFGWWTLWPTSVPNEPPPPYSIAVHSIRAVISICCTYEQKKVFCS